MPVPPHGGRRVGVEIVRRMHVSNRGVRCAYCAAIALVAVLALARSAYATREGAIGETWGPCPAALDAGAELDVGTRWMRARAGSVAASNLRKAATAFTNCADAEAVGIPWRYFYRWHELQCHAYLATVFEERSPPVTRREDALVGRLADWLTFNPHTPDDIRRKARDYSPAYITVCVAKNTCDVSF